MTVQKIWVYMDRTHYFTDYVLDVSQILCIWTPQFTLVKPLVLLFFNVLCEF
jgi:hypothetical protein